MSKLSEDLVCAACGNNDPAKMSHHINGPHHTVVCENVLPSGEICKNIIKHGNKEDIAKINRAKISCKP